MPYANHEGKITQKAGPTHHAKYRLAFTISPDNGQSPRPGMTQPTRLRPRTKDHGLAHYSRRRLPAYPPDAGDTTHTSPRPRKNLHEQRSTGPPTSWAGSTAPTTNSRPALHFHATLCRTRSRDLTANGTHPPLFSTKPRPRHDAMVKPATLHHRLPPPSGSPSCTPMRSRSGSTLSCCPTSIDWGSTPLQDRPWYSRTAR